MTKILVTGGLGFIGSNFIRYMLKKYHDYKIINLDKITYCGNPDNLADIESNPNYKFVKGDICDKELVNKLVAESDAIIHFAAESHVDRSIEKSDEFIRTNVIGTQTLLEAARIHENKRFHHVSTDEVYGALGETGMFSETTPYDPRSPYSASKAASDHLVRAYFHTHKLPITITNCSNNYGPYQYPEKLIPLFVTNLIEGKKVPVYGQGLNVRDWLYVEDHCEAIDLVFHEGKIGETYCIGGDCEKRNIDITKEILNEFNKGEESVEYVEDRKGHDFRYAIDFTKIKTELGWQPKYNFQEALSKTIQWYKDKEHWWRKLKMKILILGAKGMLGSDLAEEFHHSTKWDIDDLDLTDESQVMEKITNLNPDLVINAAAYTDVDGAEQNKELCSKVNTEGVGYISKACNKINATLVHFSTDYVFNGENQEGYKEDDQKQPLNQYGLAKSKGEDIIRQNHDKFYLIRTSWLFGKNGKNFVETILRLAKEKPSLEVVNDQTGCPTYTKDLAKAINSVLGKPYGSYHLTNSSKCTWFDFAKEVITIKHLNTELKPVTSKQFKRPAKRPKYSILVNTKLTPLRPWQEALKEYLK